MQRYPASPPPLSNQDTYTTWPGGVDPTARVYDSVGGKRSGNKRARVGGKSPKNILRRRKTPRRRMTKRAKRNNRKANRRTRRH